MSNLQLMPKWSLMQPISQIFADDLKLAEVRPIFKKESTLDKKNYRPVSVLPCMTKLFESVLIDQMTSFLEPAMSPHISGFRKGYSCESVLLNLIDNCKQALDNKQYCATVLTDLSKAFDCLPHGFLVSKLNAYGFDSNACMLMASYFRNRKQRVKIGNQKSMWKLVNKGAAQGSQIGPFAFNIYSNDLLYLVENVCNIYNYADDNTICVFGETIENVIRNAQLATDVMLNWFKNNYLQVNVSKFQFILFHKEMLDQSICINDIVIMSQSSVKLLGVHIDHGMNFKLHITEIGKKAGRHINVLARLSKTLDVKEKLLLFESFILSHFNYCPLVWHNCSIYNMNKIDKL